ncbi:aminodeoxychorismate synthase component I [Alkalimonas sp.]|uniref:aminodeoxychorismate synthase component I n=1 Tax=Alkalimonas sp. TaxID=1872453 RepID=UPI00263B74C1|nr:aminodeoxychorismate synthase component I [Alkalimonas sp.]MCC5824574.1 aminodeoxychorismate synthase component I [Alkalimonas sp.]
MQHYHIIGDAPSDLLEFFAPLAEQPWAILLDSAGPVAKNNRFDVLAAEPVCTIEAKDGHTVLTNDKGSHHYQQHPLAVVKAALRCYFPEPAPKLDLPFQGGALGYLGYDLGRYSEQIPDVATKDLPLPDMAIGIYLWALVLDKEKQQLWYLDYRGDAEQNWNKLSSRLGLHQQESEPFALTSDWQANMDKAGYQARFDQVHEHLLAGDCYQINLAQRFSASYQGSEWQAYLKLRTANAAPFSAFMRLPEGAVLSISPERFLQLHGREVETKPIKGTKARHSDAKLDAETAEALRNSPKDRAENVMIVDLLRNDLGRVAEPGSVRVPDLFAIESYPAVHHLVSTVTATLRADLDATDLLQAAFPGGSITGAPKISAMTIIEQLEPHRRSVYCGSIGYIDQSGDMDTNIAIRTLVACHGQLHCWAGGGIVADSEVNSEYQETLDKVSKILPNLR